MQATSIGNPMEISDFRRTEMDEFLKEVYPTGKDEHQRELVIKRIRSSGDLQIVFEAMSTMMKMTFEKLSQVERTVKEGERSEREVENEKSIIFLREVFGLSKEDQKVTNPLPELKESLKDYFKDIEDPVIFLNSLREK
jgi:hypothetical protein